MNILAAIVFFLLALLFTLAGITRIGAAVIESRYPPVGSFIDVGGAKLHYVHVKPSGNPGLPPIVFIHGASGNLLDPMLPFRPALEGRAEMLFFDRPGHGWSGRNGAGKLKPDAQAATLAQLMEKRGIGKAIVVAHSFGGSVATAFALNHPEKTAGLVFMSAATHPWPGGKTSWYYDVVATPVIGRIFSETIALPAGWLRLRAASRCVFAPNRMPDAYFSDASIPLVLRPQAFRNNGTDVAGLFDYVREAAPRYRNIAAPVIVLSGDSDTVVAEEIHSIGLARDIPRSELVWVKNLGHKPDYVATGLAVAAIEKLSGQNRDLQAMARELEQRIATDRFGPVERCAETKRLVPLPSAEEMRTLQMPLSPSEPI